MRASPLARLVLLSTLALAAPALGEGILGTWLSQDGDGRIEIRRCGEELCGAIVWMKDPLDEETGEPRTDVENPAPELRGRPVLGLDILTGFAPEPDADGKWTGGSVYDPKSGKTYKGYLALETPDRLKLRGYVGIPLFGRTARWTRVTGAADAETARD